MIETLPVNNNIAFKSEYIDYSALPGMKSLFLDYINWKEPVSKYFRWDFRNPLDINVLSGILDKKTFQRKQLADLLYRTNRNFGCAQQINNNIDRLSQSNSLVVIAGQQVGIFGGPMLTFYKAAAAVKLAAKLSTILSRPVVPMFWMATEDHDYAEANTIHIVNRANEPIDIVNPAQDDQAGRPMSQILLGDGIGHAMDALQESLIHTEFTEPLFSFLKDCYQPGVRIADAFGKWMTTLLCDYGLILLDPSDTEFNQLSVPIFEMEMNRLLDSSAPNHRLIEESLLSDGYHIQVQRTKKGPNLFYAEAERERVLFDDARQCFVMEQSRNTFSRDALLGHLAEYPQRFSSGVLLRPIIQSQILPTISFFGGPAEISYHAQIGNIFDYFGAIPPVIQPRPSISLMGQRINSILSKYEITPAQLFAGHHQVITDVLQKQFPLDLEQKMEEIRSGINDMLNSISPEVENFDEGFKRTFSTSVGKIDAELNKLKDKLFQAHKKKNSDITNQISRAYDSFFPGGIMQERVLPMIYFLNKYSPSFAGELIKQINIETFSHQIISINPT
ncbi:MAG: bacillithiol biosynthesis cysteine-adding enzyme BshC [candidate division Zixibacteria bacterium CG_4_9_14_3_um_filter_46_8]|nr:MAG: bacillithiol biosynthesis cysteine-adding enzyme BshC [candidate division Zixibacteria bacterium CG_4_9_14_3_um_filter_46_8]